MRLLPVSATEDAILDALARYQFLTAPQLLGLRVTSDRSHLYAALAKLKRRRPPAVASLSFGSIPGRGRLADINLLTPPGARLIEERERDTCQVLVHKRPSVFRNDYDHRVGCVGFHIALERWAGENGQQIDFFDTYYDPVSGGGRGIKTAPKTRIPYSGGAIVPDAVFALIGADGVTRLCVYELYCGRRTKRVEDQLRAYFQALEEDAIEERYHYDNAARILLVFADQTALDLVRDRLANHPKLATVNECFYLATRAASEADVRKCWTRFDGEAVALL